MAERRGELTPRTGTYQRRTVWPKPRTPGFSARAMYRLHRFLEPNRAYSLVARFLERYQRPGRMFTAAEESVKSRGFGCRMCGQCALPATGYACPMTCPKQLRNGPCGGVGPGGECEVHPEERCVWVVAYERAEAAGRLLDLTLLQRPVDHRMWGQSSWVNYWQGRDEGLWAAEAIHTLDARATLDAADKTLTTGNPPAAGKTPAAAATIPAAAATPSTDATPTADAAR